jgi:hypothetical protein
MMKLFRNKRAQNVAEYAILIALVVGAIIAIQTFAKRALQARVRDASKYMVDNTNFGSQITGGNTYNTAQYEPYYQNSEYNTTKSETEAKSGTGNEETYGIGSSSNRAQGGFSNVTFNGDETVANGMTF